MWWNPCAWLARRELRAAAEASCDAIVLEQLPNLRKSYARSLLAIVDFVTLGQPLQPAFVVAFGESRSLKRRIAMVATKNIHPHISTTSWALLICAALLIFAFPTRAQEKQEPPAAAVQAAPPKESNEAAEAEQTDAPLKLSKDVGPEEIAGVVVDSQGNPLAGVLVDAWTWYPGDETTTKEDGVFRLTPSSDDARFVEVRFSKPDYSPHYVVQQPRGAKDVVITLGNRTYLEGTLRDPDGKPVANATINGEQGNKQGDGVMIARVPTTTKSDVQGHYRMYVFPDTYDIQVAVAGTGVARIPGVTVSVDQARQLDIDLEPGVRFEAEVVDTNTGKPVEKVALFNWRDKNVRGISDAEGKIVIEGMLPGKYEFSVGQGEPKKVRSFDIYEHGDLGRWWSSAAVNEWEHRKMDEGVWQRNFDHLTFDLSVGMKPVTIEVEQGVVFSGHVYDPDGKPVAGATVAPAKTGSGNSLTGDTRYSVKTEKDGSYRVVMPAGNEFTYNLIAHDGDYGQWRTWANAVSEPLPTKPGQTFNDFDFKLTRGATVRGRVVADGDRVIGKREVRAEAADLRENRYYDPTVKVREDGSFELKFIRPGEQYIQVSPFWLRASEGPQESSVLVNLKEDEVLEGIELKVAPSAEPTSPTLAARTFRVRVLDAQGNPAAGARLAIATANNPLNLTALVGDRHGLTERVNTTAIGGQQFTAGADGVVELKGAQMFDRQVSWATAVAINAEFGQAAVGALFADLKTPEITLRMAPTHEVTLSISTADLPGPGERSHIYLLSGNAFLLSTQLKNDSLVIQLPPGDYKLSVVNSLAKPNVVDFTVKPDVPDLPLDPIRLAPTLLATMIGKPAPELRGIAEWRGEPLNLADLRGRVVILDFWGYWCGPCLASMPNLMKIYDAYPEKDVVIIAVHDATVTSIDQMNKQTETAKKNIWGSRDLPFRIALAGGGPTAVEGTEAKANGQTIADYGINSFPTTLLINQQGNLVTRLNHSDLEDTKKRIDKLLGK
jgi:thiol-disulfide isomerase/thioredoxin/protocatechuate 3,4-dioxygenase beta subunit